MRIPRTSVRTTWRTDWLTEFGVALSALALLTREIALAAVGLGILVALASLGLVFHLRLGTMEREFVLEQRLSKNRVFLGDSIEGELTLRNDSQLVAYVLSVQAVVAKALRFELPRPFRQVLRPGNVQSSKFAIVTLARGRFKISGFTLTFADSRSLFTGEIAFANIGWIEAYPSTHVRVPVTPLRLYGGASDISRKASTGIDYGGVREYTPGDEYHRVEWKATARLRKLMVREFHPETNMILQVLIDAGRMMQERSYVGTRLDEALGVAQLIVESALESGAHIGIWIYNETGIVGALTPATAMEQLVSLRNLALTLRAQATDTELALQVPHSRVHLGATPLSLRSERVTGFLRSLQLRVGIRYRKTGLYRVMAEVNRPGLKQILILLTDLTGNSPLLEAVLSHRERVIVAQIGAAWRLCDNLEDAYVQHENNSQNLERLERLGLKVFDLRPEKLMGQIARATRSYGIH